LTLSTTFKSGSSAIPPIAPPTSKPPDAAETPAAAAQAAKRRAGRFWEIDALRGVAIITMIVYHTMWDLWYWGVFPNVVLWQGFWFYWQRFTCGTFLTLVGVSLTISNRRMRARAKPGERIYPHFFWRGLRIFGLGMIITVAVLVAGVGYVDFGILHLIGISIILAYPFLRFKWLNLALWIVFSLIGEVVEWIHVDTRWLTAFGITPQPYPAVDFFPLFPWFGVVLLGVFLGNVLYADNKRRFPLPAWGDFFPFNALEFLGRHSLVIYMIHQPIILLVLYLLGIVKI
jgi:uncharacterized membrane protein